MSLLFVKILRQACKTFDQSNKASFHANFALLKQLTEELTCRDIQIQPQQFEEIFRNPERAPCTYMHIFENDIVSMSVFVMREGFTMPLHDHPCMHGLLRGLFGKLKVQCYSKPLLNQNEPLYNPNDLEIYAYANEPIFVDPNTECATLTPTERNYHEITATGGMAAFFDILGPPYDAIIPVFGSRRCNFYCIGSPKTRRNVACHTGYYGKQHLPLMCLQRIPAPECYYCDTLETPKEVLNNTYLFLNEMYNLS